MLKIVEYKKGKYVISNGLEFESIAEVKAFLKGIEFAQESMNKTANMIINNAVNCVRIRS